MPLLQSAQPMQRFQPRKARRVLSLLLGMLALLCVGSLARAQSTDDATSTTTNGSVLVINGATNTTTSGGITISSGTTDLWLSGVTLTLNGSSSVSRLSNSSASTMNVLQWTDTTGSITPFTYDVGTPVIVNGSSLNTWNTTTDTTSTPALSLNGVNRLDLSNTLSFGSGLSFSNSTPYDLLDLTSLSTSGLGISWDLTTLTVGNPYGVITTVGGPMSSTSTTASTVTTTGSTLSLTKNGGQALTLNNVYTGAVNINGANILTNGNALGTVSYATNTLTLTGGGTIDLAALSASGVTLVLGNPPTAGAAGTAPTVSLTTTGTAQTTSGTVRVTALGSVPVGSAPTSVSFATPAVALLGVGSVGVQSLAERGVVYSQTSTNNSPTIGGNGVVKVVHTGLANSAGSFSLTAAGLAANTSYTYRVYATDSTGVTTLSTPSTFKTPTVLQNWRQTFFGTTQGADVAADNADPDGDGVPNLLEFATGKDPTTSQNSSTTASTNVTGSNLEYLYTRSLDAVNAGTTFVVEWNDSLNPAQWSSAGVSEVVVSDDGIKQQVKASVPAGSTGRRFMRLKVVPPPAQ